jgi:hypothetical protein
MNIWLSIMRLAKTELLWFVWPMFFYFMLVLVIVGIGIPLSH